MLVERFLNDRVTLHPGNCLEVLTRLEECSIDACVTDPPYHLTSIVKRFGAENAAPAKSNGATGVYGRAAAGFMGKQWDGGDIAFRVELWREVYRVLKPGAHLLAFSGTRTYHRMACAIEDAGFEIRDQVGFAYGSGFPKSHNISRAIGVCACEALSECAVRSVWDADVPETRRDGEECSEVLFASLPEQSPYATEPRTKPQESPLGGEESIVEGRRHFSSPQGKLCVSEVRALPAGPARYGEGGRLCDGASDGHGAADRPVAAQSGVRASSRSQPAEQQPEQSRTLALQQEPQKRGAWDHCHRCGKPLVPDGLGTALKPAWEPIVLARKPLSESTVAANVLKWGTGAINVDQCRVGSDGGTSSVGDPNYKNEVYGRGMGGLEIVDAGKGRWPANIIHDGSDEVVEAFPQVDGVVGALHDPNGSLGYHGGAGGAYRKGTPDEGSAARFFYTAKADSDDRLGSKHPTVKPLDLMQYLVRLVTPPRGLVLDCFAGTGTTGEAAWREGMRAVLIEREEEYQNDIRRRMSLCLAGPDERKRESIKARSKDKPVDAGPLFGGLE